MINFVSNPFEVLALSVFAILCAGAIGLIFLKCERAVMDMAASIRHKNGKQ